MDGEKRMKQADSAVKLGTSTLRPPVIGVVPPVPEVENTIFTE